MNRKGQVLGKHGVDINGFRTRDLAIRSQYNLEGMTRQGFR